MTEKNEKVFNVSSEYMREMFVQYQLSIQQAIIFYARDALKMEFDEIDEALGRWPGSSVQSYRGAVYKIRINELGNG